MRIKTAEAADWVGQKVELQGWLYWKRDLGGISFALLRDGYGVLQVVFKGGGELPVLESALRVKGEIVASAQAPGGFELVAEDLEVLSPALEPPPVELPKEAWRANPETLLDYRYVTLRGERARAPLALQAALVRGYRQFLDSAGFTEVFTPKIVAAGAEGGAALFPVQYFEQKAYLAQSPQLYKQMMVGVFERVYEVAPVFRAEEHATPRHLNEYLSLDLETGFIEGLDDLINLHEQLLAAMLKEAQEGAAPALTVLEADFPKLPLPLPRITLYEARTLLRERYGHRMAGKDLDPEGERILGQHFHELGSDWVFVTHYPTEARPFYAYPGPEGTTLSFDLLFRGLEITTGGQRIHEYGALIEAMEARGIDQNAFKGYLETFRHGMPPHGGFAIGAERITARIAGLPNVRYARAFPRDRRRLWP